MGLIDYLIRKEREEFEKVTQDRYGCYEYPKDVLRLPNIRYNTRFDRCTLDVYRLDNSYENMPVIINVHGGGLIMGNKEFNTYFCAQLAKLGFVVFSVEYRLVPEVRAYDQWDDVSRAMDFVKENAKAFGGDASNAYMVGDSAGAYLIVYALALQENTRLFCAANVKPSRLKINAIGLISGMFYTTKLDAIGLFLSKALYGKGFRRRGIAKYTDPSYPGIIKCIPPSYLITSGSDFLSSYTDEFSNALQKIGTRFEKHKYDPEGSDSRLGHAFPVFEPDLEESREVIKNMANFFNQNRSEGMAFE